MRTIYIYLSWTGWIWFLFVGSYFVLRLRKERSASKRPGFPVVLISDKTDQQNRMEAQKPQ
jgi:hypothetical protein